MDAKTAMDSINNLAEALKQCSAIADKMQKALEVIVRTPHIHEYLTVADPKALEQASRALGNPEGHMGGLPSLKNMNLIIEALKLLRDTKAEDTGDEQAQREALNAQHLIERLEPGFEAAAERADKIFAEEMAKERRKAAYEDNDGTFAADDHDGIDERAGAIIITRN